MNRIALAVAVALAASPALAGTPINQTRPLLANGEVHIENIKGSITVRTWARPEVQISGDLGKGVEKLDISGDERSLDIEVKYPNRLGPVGQRRSQRADPA